MLLPISSRLSQAIRLALILGAGLMARPVAAEEPQRIDLWNGQAALGDGQTEPAEVWLTVYRPEKGNGTAIVICPGGGYGGHAIEPDGHGIARWLNGHGITGAVLQYRLPLALTGASRNSAGRR